MYWCASPLHASPHAYVLVCQSLACVDPCADPIILGREEVDSFQMEKCKYAFVLWIIGMQDTHRQANWHWMINWY